jgi:hypothetical protein
MGLRVPDTVSQAHGAGSGAEAGEEAGEGATSATATTATAPTAAAVQQQQQDSSNKSNNNNKTKSKLKQKPLQRSLTPHLDCCPHLMHGTMTMTVTEPVTREPGAAGAAHPVHAHVKGAAKEYPRWRPIQCMLALTPTPLKVLYD